MAIRVEYLLTGMVVALLLAMALIVVVSAAWLILKPQISLDSITSIFAPTTTTTTSSTTTSTTSTSTSTSTTSTTTTLPPTTTTTLPPFYICEDTITQTGMLNTTCQEKISGANGIKFSSAKSSFKDCTIKAQVIYNLTNSIGAYDEYRSKIDGSICQYGQVKITPSQISMFLTYTIPQHLNATRDAVLVKP